MLGSRYFILNTLGRSSLVKFALGNFDEVFILFCFVFTPGEKYFLLRVFKNVF